MRPFNRIYSTAQILAWQPCQDYATIIPSLVGNGVTLLQVLHSTRITAKEKLWFITRPGALSEDILKKWTNTFVERTIRRILGMSGSPVWEKWANNWLSGQDRSAYAAKVAAQEIDGRHASQWEDDYILEGNEPLPDIEAEYAAKAAEYSARIGAPSGAPSSEWAADEAAYWAVEAGVETLVNIVIDLIKILEDEK